MPNETHKKMLEALIKANMPPIVLNASYHIIFRKYDLKIVKSYELQRGDLRLISFSAKEFVTGLSDGQWMELLQAYQTLIGVVEYAKNHNIERAVV